ncbi:MAG: hypothetical protein C5B50_30150 [Verrucomicrobia bacterium]|nr:MAG: hypothetical protein C5B50_30150 [Verrucomicrobiota bacterium]
MKKLLGLILALHLAQLAHAQGVSQSPPSPDASPTSAPLALQYQIVESGPHHRIFEASDPAQTNSPAPTHKHRIHAIASGMNYFDGQNWVPSMPAFDFDGSAFVAAKVQHQARIAADLNTTNAVTLNCGGTTLNSTPLALLLYSPSSGESLILASITNCQPIVTATNEILFENALVGSLSVSIAYRIEQGAFHQNAVVPAFDPADYGFPDDAQLQLLTELYNPPIPLTRTNVLTSALRSTNQVTDTTLFFGPLVFGMGRAFYAADSQSNLVSAPVFKNYFQTPDLRWILRETLPWSSVVNALKRTPNVGQASRLPPSTLEAGLTPHHPPSTIHHPAALYAALPRPGKPLNRAATVIASPARAERPARTYPSLASLPIPKPGQPRHSTNPRPSLTSPVAISPLLRPHPSSPTPASGPLLTLDYIVTLDAGSSQPFTFTNSTWFIAGSCYFYDDVTITGGAVFKFPQSSSCIGDGYTCGYDYIQLNGGFATTASALHPAVFTACDDNVSGDPFTTNIWSGYTGNPNGNVYGTCALWFLWPPSPVEISHMRFSYMSEAVVMDFGGTMTVADSQFVNSYLGVWVGGDCCETVTMNNCLSANVGTLFYPDDEYNSWALCNCTVDGNTQVLGSGTGTTLSCTNCIFSNGADTSSASGSHNGFYNSSSFGDNAITANAFPFQTVACGNYYLSGGSENIFRGAGTTNIGSLWTDLQTKSTYPPIFHSNVTFTGSVTFSPEAQRETGAPDLGFGYDVLDHVFAQTWFTNSAVTNGTFTFTEGTAIGVYPTPFAAIYLCRGANLLSSGTVLNPVSIAELGAIQESSWPIVGVAGISAALMVWPAASDNPPQAYFRFTDFFGLAQDGQHFHQYGPTQQLGFRDCEFHSGGFVLRNPPFYMTNSLLDEVVSDIEDINGNGLSVGFFNNLAHRGSCLLMGGPTWVFQNNAFDNVPITDFSDPANPITGDHNAYIGRTNYMAGGLQTGDQTLTNFAWQRGPLGPWYQPGGTNNSFLYAGAGPAAAYGLYHYTVLTNSLKDSTNTVSLGLHFVALGTNGQPVSTSGDGLGDYQKDSNGDGIYNAGDLGNWQTNDTCGDGISDYIKYLEGRNLNVNAVPDTNGVINLQIYTPLR